MSLPSFMRDAASLYYLLWLVAGLLVSAIISALLAQRLHAREMRHLKAIQALRALDRYALWVSRQCRVVFFQIATQEGDSVLQEIGAIQQQYFPQLWPQAQELFTVHARLLRFLRAQHELFLNDPEGWLESDADTGFVPLWREHRRTARALEQRLAPVARSPARTPRSISPA